MGITATFDDKDVNIQARRGVIVATGGHTANVEFRRMFDPRLTEEYQTAGEPWTRQMAEGELAAMDIGASLWATSNVANEVGRTVTKTIHIGCRYGYQNLKWNPRSPLFDRAGASGLTVQDFQDVILVNQIGRRFWNEMDETYDFLNACLGTNGNMGKGAKVNGGGPIWAIFDSGAVQRERWDPRPPNVDPSGWFFSAGTIAELAGKIANPYQLQPVLARDLEETVTKYNSWVDAGKDQEFREAHAQIQNPDATVLCRVVHAHPSRFPHRSQDQPQVSGYRYTRPSRTGPILCRRISRRVRPSRFASRHGLWPGRGPGSRARESLTGCCAELEAAGEVGTKLI